MTCLILITLPYSGTRKQFCPNIYSPSIHDLDREKTTVKHIDEIALFFVENENVYFHTFDGEKYSLLKKLEYIESVCDPAQFFRINRQDAGQPEGRHRF